MMYCYNRRFFPRIFSVLICGCLLTRAEISGKPNIVWIIAEDMGDHMGCSGTNVLTPNLDRLAAEGTRFSEMFGTASVCMPNRTAMIMGVTQTTVGAVSMIPPKKFMKPLKNGMKPIPALLRDEYGYLTANVLDKEIGSTAKDHWNFQYDGKGWDTARLSDLTGEQPFYAQFNFHEAHRPFKPDRKNPVDPGKVEIPPFYPDHPVTRRSWADYLESIQQLDRGVGEVLDWLEKSGFAENTIVFFYTDNGPPFLRGKYFLYDHSLRQPLIVRWPEALNPPDKIKPGSVNGEMISGIDVTAQTVVCAGGAVPEWMHGRAFLSADAKPREEVFSAADWYGDAYLKSRSIRTPRYKYIRNFNTDLSVLSSSSEYRRGMHPMYALVGILSERDQLSVLHRKLLVEKLPKEELYDLEKDPDELENLAGKSKMKELKEQLASRLETWIEESGDLGFEEKDPEHIEFFKEYQRKGHKKFGTKHKRHRESIIQSYPE